jgi:hypothetical protein
MPKFIIVHYEEDPEAIMQFENSVRGLWSDHVDYTRNAIISILGGLDDINAVADRLDKNQDAIAEILAPYYGSAATETAKTALKEHVSIITDIVRYKKANRDTAELETKLDANAVAIAEFLSGLDPSNWPKSLVVEALRAHITHTLAEINARVAKDWTADIAAYDQVRNTIKVIADTMSTGIIDKFPEKFVKYDL